MDPSSKIIPKEAHPSTNVLCFLPTLLKTRALLQKFRAAPLGLASHPAAFPAIYEVGLVISRLRRWRKEPEQIHL